MKNKIFMALLAGTMLLAACKGSHSNYEVANTGLTADSTSTSKADTTGIPKLVKTAEMRFKVKSVTKAGEDIATLTVKYNGMVMHHEVSSTAERSNNVRLNDDSVMRVMSLHTSADMTVKVPSEKLEDFMNQVSRMGLYVNLRKMDIEDHTLDYLANKLKLDSRKEVIARQKKGKVIIKHAEDVMALKDDMIDQQINNRRVNEAVKYSVLSLNLYQSNTISKEVIANDDPAAYSLPFFNRIGLAINNGWYIFKEMLISIANLWVLILISALVWAAIRDYKKRNQQVSQPHI